ncbi:Dabb family protein [Undibacterium sp.]|uniref:Dabb family protein n=1 Tax=Undibacterium sp. TaxID=1914977 RepID=UPI0025EC007C|nr:Dabb family protein [Undibacterium sp.]
MLGHIAAFSHHVLFCLKHPDSSEDRAQLLAALHALAQIEVVRGMHISLPAAPDHDPVVDRNYDLSLLLFFDSIEDEKTYQSHALHQKFIQENAALLGSVRVFDSFSQNSN